MYQPDLFREERLEVKQALIRKHPLGLLISCGSDGPVANLLPFELRRGTSEFGVLHGHLARANPQWRALHHQPVLVVFQGPDAYISPSLYQTKRDTGKAVPTWNYAMVQARGTATVRDDPEWVAGQVNALTAAREATRPNPWSVADAPRDYIQLQLKSIVGIEIEIATLDGKWKVSQNQPETNRRSVAAGLAAEDSTGEMVELVRRYGKLD
jgi:transcriptional regulator